MAFLRVRGRGRTIGTVVVLAVVTAVGGTASANPEIVAPRAAAATPPAVAPAPQPPQPEPAEVVADRLAGVLGPGIPESGTGRFTVAPGSTAPAGPGRVRTVRVEVEDGLPIDNAAFADFVLRTLNDPRGWGRGAAMTFTRTDGPAQILVRLASPATSRALCRPLETYGKLSCGNGARAVITHYRWVAGIPDYQGDLTGYRQYVINHEVGHVLGHGHEPCPGQGRAAPVMMQQTKGLRGCLPNSWPHP